MFADAHDMLRIKFMMSRMTWDLRCTHTPLYVRRKLVRLNFRPPSELPRFRELSSQRRRCSSSLRVLGEAGPLPCRIVWGLFSCVLSRQSVPGSIQEG